MDFIFSAEGVSLNDDEIVCVKQSVRKILSLLDNKMRELLSLELYRIWENQRMLSSVKIEYTGWFAHLYFSLHENDGIAKRFPLHLLGYRDSQTRGYYVAENFISSHVIFYGDALVGELFMELEDGYLVYIGMTMTQWDVADSYREEVFLPKVSDNFSLG